MAAAKGSSQGPATDSSNTPVVDPTDNVMKLVEASSRRIDDIARAESRRIDELMTGERRYNDIRAEHKKELLALYAAHSNELSMKESSRLDSIRQVDREDVAKTAAAANNAILALAKQTTDLASTLQSQVGATAAAAETRRSADMSEVNKRVSALELASSASAGKQTIADPQVAELRLAVSSLIAAQNTATGFTAGKAAAIAAGLAAATALGGGGAALVMRMMQQ